MLDFSVDLEKFYSLGGVLLVYFGFIWTISYSLKLARDS